MSELFEILFGGLIIFIVGIWLGMLVQKDSVQNDCNKMGTTIINQAVYECRKKP